VTDYQYSKFHDWFSTLIDGENRCILLPPLLYRACFKPLQWPRDYYLSMLFEVAPIQNKTFGLYNSDVSTKSRA